MLSLKAGRGTQLNQLNLRISAQHSNQSPVSLTSDASSPRPYVSPRNGTPQSSQKSIHPGSAASAQARVRERGGWGGVISPVFMVDRCCLGLCRAARLQSNRDRLLCLRRQRSTQRTPEPSSREGPGLPEPPQYVSRHGLCSPPPVCRLCPPARRSRARAQTHPGPCCPTCPPVAPANPRLTAPAPSPRHWQLTSMRPWSDTSRGGLQRPLRNRYVPLGLLPLVFLPSAASLYPTGETSSLKWSQPRFLAFPVLKLVLLS